MKRFLARTWIVEKHRRHRASLAGLPADVLLTVLWLGSILLAALPYVQRLAWLFPLLLLLLERRSRMLRRAAADQFLLLLLYSLILGLLEIISDLINHRTILSPAADKAYTASVIRAAEYTSYVGYIKAFVLVLWLVYCGAGLLYSLRYGLLRWRRLRRLSGVVQQVFKPRQK